MRLLEGAVEPDDLVDAQRNEITRLRDALADAQADADAARSDAAAARREAAGALGELRRQLGPLYRALCQVFGELDRLPPDIDAPPPAAAGATPRTAAIWDAWKTRLPGYPARVIDALLLHKDMNTAQLAIAVGCRPQRISEAISKLNRAGLIDKNGGRFALKTLPQ